MIPAARGKPATGYTFGPGGARTDFVMPDRVQPSPASSGASPGAPSAFEEGDPLAWFNPELGGQFISGGEGKAGGTCAGVACGTARSDQQGLGGETDLLDAAALVTGVVAGGEPVEGGKLHGHPSGACTTCDDSRVRQAAASAEGGLAAVTGKIAAKIVSMARAARAIERGTIAVSTTAPERLVIGRGPDLRKARQVKPGEYKLEWPSKLPDFKAEWKENSRRLRLEMRHQRPIRDASPGDTGGMFLNAEPNLLQDRGWTFDSSRNFWMPPSAY